MQLRKIENVSHLRRSPVADWNERLPDLLDHGLVHQFKHLPVVGVLFHPGHQTRLAHHLISQTIIGQGSTGIRPRGALTV